MLPRLAVVAAVAIAFSALLGVRVTLPALSLVGIVAWAVAASVAAIVLYTANRKGLDR